MNKKVLVIPFILFFFACSKEKIEVCKKRRAISVTIFYLPAGIDVFSQPDLRCDISPSNSDYWAYYSNSVDNISGLPVTIYFPNPVLFSEEQWSLRLVDEDIGADDEIYKATFEPYAKNETTAIEFKLEDGTIAFELNFTESE